MEGEENTLTETQHKTKQKKTTSKMHNSTYNGCLVLKKRETKKK